MLLKKEETRNVSEKGHKLSVTVFPEDLELELGTEEWVVFLQVEMGAKCWEVCCIPGGLPILSKKREKG